MSLFGDQTEDPGSSGLFTDDTTRSPYDTTDLRDSADDIERHSNFRGVLRLAVFSLVLLVVTAGVFTIVGWVRNERSGRGDLTADLTGRTVPTLPAGTPNPTSPAPVGSSTGAGSGLENAIRSVVLILVGDRTQFCASGSGFAVDDGSIVVTNNHVIESSPECRVEIIEILVTTDPAKEPEPRYFGRVLSSDPTTDLAVLSLIDERGAAGRLTPLPIATHAATVGEDLQIIGFPGIGGFTVTVTQGSVAGFTEDASGRWLKTDASISGGNSGGAAINSDGELVAVPTLAGGGGREIVDCRDFDTNHDGTIDSKDSCIPIGGFLNLLRPAEYVTRAISRAR